MKIHIILASILGFLTLSSQASETSNFTQEISVRWSSAQTMAAGAAVGGIEGILSRLTDHVWPFNWFLLAEARSLLNSAIVNDAQRKHETVNHALLQNSSWLASWVAYLACFNSVRIEYNPQTLYIVAI